MVQFGKPHCAPCRTLEPVLARLAKKYQGRINIVYFDLGRRYSIWAVPTIIGFSGGEDHRLKARDQKSLDEALRALLAQAQAVPAASDTTGHNPAPQTEA